MMGAFSLYYGPASATAPGYLTTGSQTIAGSKTFANYLSVTDTASQVRFGDVATRSGLFANSGIGCLGWQVLNLAGGWTAEGTEAAFIGSNASYALGVWGNTGLTAGNAYAPTQLASVDYSGNAAFNGNLTVGIASSPVAIIANCTTTDNPTDTTRSVGTRFTLYPAISGSQTDFAIGVNGTGIWNSVPQNSSAQGFYWFGNTTQVASIDGIGNAAFNGNVYAGGSGAARMHAITASDTTNGLLGSFGSSAFVVGEAGASGSSAGGFFVTYNQTSGSAFIGALSPGTAWRSMNVAVGGGLNFYGSTGTTVGSISNTGQAVFNGSLSVGPSPTAITNVSTYSPSLTPVSVAANTTAEQTAFTVTGLTTSDKVVVNGPAPTAGTGIVGARVVSANTLGITFVNATAGALTPASGTYTVVAIRS